MTASAPYWKRIKLEDMSPSQWEALCDGCAKCCLIKLEDEDTGEIHYTDIACRLLDAGLCRCTDYANRSARVPDCVVLTPASLPSVAPWLPATCAYRLIFEGKDLYDWHPLVSGDLSSVHGAGISVKGRTIPETLVPEADQEDRVIQQDWIDDPYPEG